ncbi:hypothetical protein [Hyphomicrobium sp.]|nr:hypothetical protein [Hyphomicrobium sp.]
MAEGSARTLVWASAGKANAIAGNKIKTYLSITLLQSPPSSSSIYIW